MKILILNPYAGSLHHGMVYRHYYLAKNWIELGADVSIIAGSYSHLRRRQPETKGLITEERIDGIRYIWLKNGGYFGNNAKRLLNMLTYELGLLLYLLKKKAEFQVVYSSPTNPIDHIFAYLIARKNRAKFCCEVRDIWPLTPVELGRISKGNPAIKLMKRAERFAYTKADTLISVLPNLSLYLKEHGYAPRKIIYAPNGIDISEWENLDQSAPSDFIKTIDKKKAEGNLIVGYVGSHKVSNALEYLLKCAKLSVNDKIFYILVGEGPEKQSLKDYATDEELRNILFYNAVPKATVPSILSHMDLLYIGWKKADLYKYGINPNKIIEYLLSGKPVIHAVDAYNDIVKDLGMGISVAPENEEALYQALRQFANHDTELHQSIYAESKSTLEKDYDYKNIAKSLFKQITG